MWREGRLRARLARRCPRRRPRVSPRSRRARPSIRSSSNCRPQKAARRASFDPRLDHRDRAITISVSAMQSAGGSLDRGPNRVFSLGNSIGALMIEYLRAASQGFVGRAIMTVVLGFIVFSFALWGTGDAFRGYGTNKVASVGGAAITPDEFRFAYQNALQQYQRRLKAPITNAQAHAMGLDVQTLGRLIADAALDERARALGLAVSDDELVKAIREAPGLQDDKGGFDRDKFNQLLRDSGLSERGFFNEQRKVTLRQQIGVSLAAEIVAPKPLIEALAHFSGQSRAIDYVILPPSAAGDIPAPTPEQAQSFFNERKANFQAPEYRSTNLLAVTPSMLAKPDEVSESDVRALYERVKDQRFGVAEKRALQQIVFPNEAEAAEALAKIKAGD